MFIVKPELDDEQVNTATERVHQLIVSNGGTVTKTSAWGKRRLAYRIAHFHEGYYVVSHFDLEADRVRELDRVLKISDADFRHLVVRREKPTGGYVEVPAPEPGDLEEFAGTVDEAEEAAEEAPQREAAEPGEDLLPEADPDQDIEGEPAHPTNAGQGERGQSPDASDGEEGES